MLAPRPALSEYVKLDRMCRSGAVCILQPNLILRPRIRLSSHPRSYHRSYLLYQARDSTLRSEMGTEGGFERGSNGTGRGGPNKSNNNGNHGNPNNPAPWRPYRGRWSSKTTHADQPGTQTPGNTSQDRPRRNGPRRNNRPADRRPKQRHGAIVPPHGAAPLQSPQGQVATSHAGSMGNVNSTNPPFAFPPPPGVMNANGSAIPPPPFLMPNVSNPQNSFTQNMPDQRPLLPQKMSFQPQQQFTPMFNPSSYPSFGIPESWNDFTKFTSQLLPMPPPPLMNMGMPNPLLAMSMLDPFAFRTPFTPESAPSQEQPQQPQQPNKRRSPSCEPLEPPSPTAEYLQQSSLPPKRNGSSKPLLVILDLNGTLVHRKHRMFPPSFVERAGLKSFRRCLLAKYKVMVWSSSQPFTVQNLCNRIFPGTTRKELVAEWGRDKFPLTGSQYRSKTQVYKTLDTVWRDPSIQASYPSFRGKKWHPTETQVWDQTNTILIDDSKLKAISEPYNILEIPEFTGDRGPGDNQTLTRVLELLEELSKYDDVSQTLHLWSKTLEETGKTCILDILDTLPRGPQPQTPIPLAPGATRVERRRARKQEKKAARAAAAAISTSFTTPAPAPAPAPAQAPVAPAPVRSPSPTTSLDSEHHSLSPDPSVRSDTQNDLLDKLEASLDRHD